MALPRATYTWDDMQEAARRKALRACRYLLADLLKASGKRTLGDAVRDYRAKNELDL